MVRELQALGVEIDDLKDVFQSIAVEAAAVIRPGIPVRSGRLSGTLRPNRAKSRATVTAGRASAPYAGAINYGWPARGIAGSSFMQRADEAALLARKGYMPRVLAQEARDQTGVQEIGLGLAKLAVLAVISWLVVRAELPNMVSLAGGDTAQATEVAQERRNAFEDDRSQSAAERLTEIGRAHV